MILKLIFGSQYTPQPRSFWKKFWGNKLKEILSVLKVVGIIVGIFSIIWIPAFIKLHPEFGKDCFVGKDVVSTNYNVDRHWVRVNGPEWRTLKDWCAFQDEIEKASTFISSDNYRKMYLFRDPTGPNWFTTNELIRIAMIRMTTKHWGEDLGYLELDSNDEFDVKKVKELGKQRDFEWADIRISLPYASTNVITNKIPLVKLKDVSAGNWFECIMFQIFIEGLIIGIVSGIIAWLRSNYAKLTKKEE